MQEQAPRHVREIGAGHSVIVDSSPGNPLEAGTLAAQPDVVAVAPLVRSLPEFSAPRHPDFDRWFLTGFDDRLLARATPARGLRSRRGVGACRRRPRSPDRRRPRSRVLLAARHPDRLHRAGGVAFRVPWVTIVALLAAALAASLAATALPAARAARIRPAVALRVSD